MENKPILDACCGSRMFWFDKQNPNVLFADIRREEHTLCDGRELVINPDKIMDYTGMVDIPNDTFYHVVFDPSHLVNGGDTSWIVKKYGRLPKEWRPHIKAGFSECMRVTKPYGTVIFKWNTDQIKVSEVIDCLGGSAFIRTHIRQTG